MSFSYTLTDLDGYLLCTMSGSIEDAEAMISCGSSVVPETKKRGHSNLLLDDRALKMSLSPLDITIFANHMEGINFARMGLRIAVIFPPENEEIIRFFETTLTNRSVSFRVFRNIKNAEAWLLS